MATRKIPDNPRPWWECTVNGKKYRYKSGTTVDVPDAVADIIDNINAANERPAAQPDPVLPKITAADEGKVVKVVGGKYVLEEDGGGAGSKLIVTLTEDGEGDLTADKTHEEIKEAFDAGIDVILFKDGDTRLRVQMVNSESIISEMINVFTDDAVFGVCFSETDGIWTEHNELRMIEADNG